jgi:hypothetical protein
MRIFQIINSYNSYIENFESRVNTNNLSFQEHRRLLIKDYFYGTHILEPIYQESKYAFYSMWNYPTLQHKWAKEKGWNETNLKKILFAQIEDFKTDVLYNISPTKFDTNEIRKNISNTTKTVCWYASPDPFNSVNEYDAILSNHHGLIKDINKTYHKKAHFFQPSIDYAMGVFSKPYNDREIDIIFYGQYHEKAFQRRNKLIRDLIELKKSTNLNIQLFLKYDTQNLPIYPFKKPYRINKLLRNYKLPIIAFPEKSIRQLSNRPIYGTDVYKHIGNAKIVFNAAVDMAGNLMYNMRNFEALGSGAHLIGEEGTYPDGFIKNKHYSTFENFYDFRKTAEYFLGHADRSSEIADAGNKMVENYYSKAKQFKSFQEILA